MYTIICFYVDISRVLLHKYVNYLLRDLISLWLQTSVEDTSPMVTYRYQ